MATYAVGDVQGCRAELEALLELIAFDEANDELWLVGDLINRGPDSLGTLRLVRKLGSAARIVLGNHDLHFLAVHYANHKVRRSDTLDELLGAPDVDELANWLRARPLVHHDPALGWLMVHAGVPPDWDLQTLLALAGEAQACYSGDEGEAFFAQMYGNEPARFSSDLTGLSRVRCVVNHLTRMRVLDAALGMDFAVKGPPVDLAEGMAPWFARSRAQPLGARVVFGHWAALQGETGNADVVALDTGCVWGRELTAMCLETEQRFCVAAASSGAQAE